MHLRKPYCRSIMIIIILFSVLYGDYNPRTMIIIMPFFIYLLWISEFHFECVKDKLDPLLHIFQSELLVLSSSKDPHHWWRQDFPTAWPSHGSGLAIIRKLLIVFSGRPGGFRQHQLGFSDNISFNLSSLDRPVICINLSPLPS